MFILITLLLCVLILSSIAILLNSVKNENIEDINNGHSDSEIVYEHLKQNKNKEAKIIMRIINSLLIFILGLVLLLGLLDKFINVLNYHSIVIATGSMSEKNKENQYLFDNNINNQIQIDDLIIVKDITSLSDIDLYDVICYKNNKNKQIVHRVIEKNNDYVITQGDANNVDDGIPVTLDMIVGKYTGIRIPIIGKIIFFISSTYGLLTSFTIITLIIIYSIFNDKVRKQEIKRFEYIKKGYLKNYNDYIINSKYGELIVNDNNIKYNKLNNKTKGNINSTITINNISMTIKPFINKGGRNNEK